MGEDRQNSAERRRNFQTAVARKQERKAKARREKSRGLAFGLGMFGLVGWSVAIPAVAMTALGVWLDGAYESGVSWTLTLLFVGIAAGSLNAWYWVKRESQRGMEESGGPSDDRKK